MVLDRRIVLIGLVAVATGTATSCGAARADGERDEDAHERGRHGGHDRRDADDDDDHGAAVSARSKGEILPLADIIEHVRRMHPGEIVGIEFGHEHGQWRYEMKLVTPQGRFLEIYVDASDGRIVKIEGK